MPSCIVIGSRDFPGMVQCLKMVTVQRQLESGRTWLVHSVRITQASYRNILTYGPMSYIVSTCYASMCEPVHLTYLRQHRSYQDIVMLEFNLQASTTTLQLGY